MKNSHFWTLVSVISRLDSSVGDFAKDLLEHSSSKAPLHRDIYRGMSPEKVISILDDTYMDPDARDRYEDFKVALVILNDGLI